MTQRASTAPAPTPPSPSASTTVLQMLQSRDDRIATELPELPPTAHRRVRYSGDDANWSLRPVLVRAQTREEIEEDEAHARMGFQYNRYRVIREQRRWWHPVLEWWGRHVSVKVDVAKRRDHLALERTFLGYVRTSLALSMAGVTISQLFRLQHSLAPNTVFGYYVAGEPLAGCFISASIVVVLLGAIRFWRQQNAMVRGKVWAGGWEIVLIMVLSILLCVGLFAVAVGVTIEHSVND